MRIIPYMMQFLLSYNTPEDIYEKGIKIGNVGTLYFITDYNDTEKDIFDEFNADEKLNLTLICIMYNDIYGKKKLRI